ncbi:hypothetical protein IMSHALPRED_002212 [Imshaugia aleurites]|uniref:Uncharacterized protein n=1 Tax=Imshaugia aleurites TaxID=172621 RepID=A0A8H3PHL5_9LECA|nr:hypothetical protein IMSHALPRED_002212 [Imshaugia aleurites]
MAVRADPTKAHTLASLVPPVLSEQFYAVHKWDSPAVKKAQRQAQSLVWNPWPVNHTVIDKVFSAAQTLVRIHNDKCITCSQRITLLPASGNDPYLQGGSENRGLYSIRSPSALPVKIHIWQTPGAKIMSSQGLRTAALTSILASFGNLKKDNMNACDICKHYRCWKSRSITKKWLQHVPTRLHHTVHERWWAFNGFSFLSLPFELREMVLRINIGPLVEPWRQVISNSGRRLNAPRPRSSKPDLSLASVNKQLYSEVMTTLHLHTTFYFCHKLRFEWFFQQTENPPSYQHAIVPASRSLVRKVELDLGPLQLCELLDIPKDARVGDSRRQRYTSVLGKGFVFYTKTLPLQRVRINLPAASYYWKEPGCDLTVCQRMFCLRIWAGIRVLLRDVPVIELGGHIDEAKRREWMQELALERRGIIPDLKELEAWQKNIWEQW